MEYLILGLAITAVVLIIRNSSQLSELGDQTTLLKWQIEKLRSEIFNNQAKSTETKSADTVTEITPLVSVQVTLSDEAEAPKIVVQPAESVTQHIPEVPVSPEMPPLPHVEQAQPVQMPEAEPKSEPVAVEPVGVPAIPTVPPPIPTVSMTMRSEPAANKIEKKRDFEKLIGENLLGKVGVLILLVGMGFFMKYAIDWLGDGMRATVGYMVAAVLGLVGWKMAKEMKVFSSVLYGGAMGVIYVTTAIARYMYDVYPWWVAVAILVATMVGMAFMSLHYNRRELAILAVVGGFCAPFIVNNWVDGGVLLGYVALLNVGAFVVSMRKSWFELPLLAFVLTQAVIVRVLLAEINDYVFWAFIAGFYLLFQLMFRRFAKMENPGWRDVFLLALNCGGVLALVYGMTANVYAWGYKLPGAMAAFVGCVNFVLFVIDWRKVAADGSKKVSVLTSCFLMNAALYLTLAVPVQFDGEVVVMLWSVEMAVLYWWALRARREFERVLYVNICAISFTSFMISMTGGGHYGGVLWQNGAFWTGSFTLAVWVGIAFWADRMRERLTTENHGILAWEVIRIFQIAVPVLLIYVFVNSIISVQVYYDQIVTWRAIFSMVYILGLFLLLRTRYRVAGRMQGIYLVGALLTLLIMVGNNRSCNLDWAVALYHVIAGVYVGILTRDVLRITDMPAASRRAFVIALNVAIIVWCESMALYILRLVDGSQANAMMTIVLAGIAVGQVVFGVVKRQYLVRVIGLVVFCVTIAKLLLVDLWLMSPTGRIVSFVILGVVMIAVSFIYQKIKTLLQKNE